LYGSAAWPVSLALVSAMAVGLSCGGAIFIRGLCPVIIGEKRIALKT
jgi:hypothetical protein